MCHVNQGELNYALKRDWQIQTSTVWGLKGTPTTCWISMAEPESCPQPGGMDEMHLGWEAGEDDFVNSFHLML